MTTAESLREAELRAKRALERACAEDVAALGNLLRRPLQRAKSELEEYALSLGSMETTLRRNLVREQAADIALRCVRAAFANADVRFRARFAMYADALLEAEARCLAPLGERARRIAIPHLEFDDDSRIDADDLERSVREALARAIERARSRVLKRGFASLARARVALRKSGGTGPRHSSSPGARRGQS
jgi:hypothetical protein